MFYLTSRLYDLEVRGSRPSSSASKGMLEAVGDIAILLLPSHTLPLPPPPPLAHTGIPVHRTATLLPPGQLPGMPDSCW